MSVENHSGFLPCEYKILVKPDEVKERAGDIYIPPQIQEKERREQIFGTLIAVGGCAFEDWKPPIPKPGDRVMVARYAGVSHKGLDDQWYCIMYDKDIAAMVDETVKKDLSETDQPDMAGDGAYASLRAQ